MMQSWDNISEPFSGYAYEFLRSKGTSVSWIKVVWEPWCLPRHSFILWLALLWRLRTRNRLHFVDTDASYVFYQDHKESHSHLSLLTVGHPSYGRIKSWLRLCRGMTTISNVVRGLYLKRKNDVVGMKWVSLSIVIYLIWEERNKKVFENFCILVESLFWRFQVLFYMILHFHERNHL